MPKMKPGTRFPLRRDNEAGCGRVMARSKTAGALFYEDSKSRSTPPPACWFATRTFLVLDGGAEFPELRHHLTGMTQHEAGGKDAGRQQDCTSSLQGHKYATLRPKACVAVPSRKWTVTRQRLAP